jgi:DNA integrity scanning protein DisA with diadenylate cyclase activity
LLKGKTTVKTKAISKLLRKKKFQELDRRLRRELAAIDGATVIRSDGTILAVGAILRIPGGSLGGGRRAAAQELGKLGLGIKVSQDGGIVGFRQNQSSPAFQVL